MSFRSDYRDYRRFQFSRWRSFLLAFWDLPGINGAVKIDG